MAHFAQLDSDNIVQQVIVLNNSDCEDDDGNESEAVGIAFCQSLFGADTVWKQTSYNNNMRVKYAGIGDKYDEALDAFIGPQPYPSWTLSSVSKDWEPPTPDPSDENTQYGWDEDTLSWIEIDVEVYYGNDQPH